AITRPELFIEPLRVLANDPDTDIIIFSEFPMNWDENTPILQEFIEICKNTDKFVLVTPFPLDGMSLPEATEVMEENGIPVIPGDLNPVRALAKLVDYSEAYHRAQQKNVVQANIKNERKDVSHLLSSENTLSES